MAYDIHQKGTEIIIIEKPDGRYIDFYAVRKEVLRKDKSIVIDKIYISNNGINYPIKNGLEKIKSGVLIEEMLSLDSIDKYNEQFKDKVKKKKEDIENKKQEISLQISDAKKTGNWENISDEVKSIALSNIVITTSFFVASHEIEREIDVITYECAYGMNIFRDLFASVRDIVGGRSKAVETVLRDARIVAMNGIREEALIIGADAVIGIDLDYSELSGGGKNGMLLAIASGTAVKLRKV